MWLLDRLWAWFNPPPVPLPTPPAPLPPGPEANVEAVFAEINRIRRDRGLKQFSYSFCLGKQAALWATEMRRRGRGSHAGMGTRLAACNMNGGEIVAWGQRTAEEVVDDWMHSPGHRARILSKSQSIGCGVDGTFWCCLDATPRDSYGGELGPGNIEHGPLPERRERYGMIG